MVPNTKIALTESLGLMKTTLCDYKTTDPSINGITAQCIGVDAIISGYAPGAWNQLYILVYEGAVPSM
jgi:hypothetical protein